MSQHVTVFTKPDCSFCARAKALLARRGMTWREYDVTGSRRHADASVYFSGAVTVPQIFFGATAIGGAEELEQADRVVGLDELIQTLPEGELALDDFSDEELARGAEDMVMRSVIPKSDGTRDADPETWPLLHFYKEFFGFWPNTFAYLHHWPEAYKRFVYCHNVSAVAAGREVLGPHMMFAIGYSASNAQGCTYCQAHSAAIAGETSLGVVGATQKVLSGETNDDAPFDGYQQMLIALAADAARNRVAPERLERIRTAAGELSERRDAEADISGTAMIASAFGFLNVFNDLVGMQIEGDWAVSVEQAGIAAGRHGAEAHNPDNLAHELPAGGPSMQDMLAAYDAEVGDVAGYTEDALGLMPAWIRAWPEQLRKRHAALYVALMADSVIGAELKHLMARVAAIAKGHAYLAAVEGFMAWRAAGRTSEAMERVRACYGAAANAPAPAPFSPAEVAALRIAWLSASTPLTTPRRHVEPALAHYDAVGLIHLFTVCGLASLVQRFVAVRTCAIEPEVAEFLDANGLETDTVRLRLPHKEPA